MEAGHWLGSPGKKGVGSVKPDKVQKVFGQYSQAYGVTFGDGPLQGQALDRMILMDPFQPRIFYDFNFLWKM